MKTEAFFLQDSVWYWEDLPDWGTYDEEQDDYRIPEGWWEYRHFNPDDVYNNLIDRPVVGWMPLPPKKIAASVFLPTETSEEAAHE